jgi:hypothetical protein
MRKKTVQISIYLLLLASLLVVSAGSISIYTAAQANPENYLPIILRDFVFSALTPGPAPSAQPTSRVPEQPRTEKTIQGYPVPDSVYNYYQKVGPETAGKVIQEYGFNSSTGRYEMWFENLAIYVAKDDPQQVVHPIPLGLQRLLGLLNATPRPGPAIPISPKIMQHFDEAYERLGGEFTGEILVPLAMNNAGEALRIYENVVMKIDPVNPDQILWVRLPELLGIIAQPPVAKIDDNRFYFYAIEDGLGYNVPVEFWEYIRNQADLNVSGRPTTEIFYANTDQTLIRQCFENLCLDFDTQSGKIGPANLGEEYYRKLYLSAQNQPLDMTTLNFNVWEAQGAIPSNQAQTIFVKMSQNNIPAINLQPLLEITLPDQSTRTYLMPPTNEQGVSSLQIEPIAAENGTIIPYQVCLIFMDTSRFCLAEQFLIWDVP